jgi:hypothetical protein
VGRARDDPKCATADRVHPAVITQLTPAKKVELRKKKIRAVLIRTVPSQQTSSETKDIRMRCLLDGAGLIDGYAYEFSAPLEAGTIAKVQGLEPEYVGQ